MYNLTQLLKNEILVYIAMWLNLDSIMQPAITDTNEQRLYNCLYKVPRTSKFVGTES